MHTLKLVSQADWRRYAKSADRPADIPSAPWEIYAGQGWVDLGDWLGTGRIAYSLKEYRPFTQARAFACRLKLKSYTEWRSYCRSGKKPEDIPALPSNTYADQGWINWGDWLGTRAIATRLQRYLPFEKARAFVRRLHLKSGNEWRDFCKSGKRPKNIPSNPDKEYKGKGWVSMGDWVGTGTIAPYKMNYRPFKEAREYVRRLGLKSQSEWQRYCKSKQKPADISASPQRTYANQGWVNQGDWLGTGVVAPRLREYKSFVEARAFAQRLHLKSAGEWREYCRSGKLPEDIPKTPNCVYEKEGWSSFGDWLGSGRIADQLREFRPFKEARDFARGLDLKSVDHWRDYCRSGKWPGDIPKMPNCVYEKEGWSSFGDWLGTGRIADNLKEYRPFKEARAFARSLGLRSWEEWRDYCKSGNRPDDIPSNPHRTYNDDGWAGMADWLGY